MSLHIAQAIGDEIRTRVAACTVAQGAETDLGATVFRGRRAVSDDMIPCVSIIEGDDHPSRERGPGVTAKLDQRYVLYAYVRCDANDPNVAAHAAIRDLKRAIFTTGGKPDQRLGGKVMRCDYLGRDIGPRGDGANFVLAVIEISVQYAEDLANP